MSESGPERVRRIMADGHNHTLTELVEALQDCSPGGTLSIFMGDEGGRAFLVHDKSLAEKIKLVIAEHEQGEEAAKEAGDWVEELRRE